MSEMIDRASEQRESDRLDQDKLSHYLKEQGVIDRSLEKIEQYSGGASNLTYRIRTDNHDYILRKPPFGHKAKSAHDMKREYVVLTALAPVLSHCPTPIHFCESDDVIGSEFYLMERIKGVIIRRSMPKAIDQSPQLHKAICQEFCDKIVSLHSIKPSDVGLEEFGKPEGYVRRQVEGWTDRMQAAKTANTQPFEELASWLSSEMPADSEQASIIHNDYKFDNVIWCPHSIAKGKPEIIGMLDWEMATLGDPLMDFGATLAYWLEATDSPEMLMLRMMPTHLEGMMTRTELADAYLTARGWPQSSLEYYRIFGLFRLAVIVQQIYYRFDLGQSDNPKFAMFGEMANQLIIAANKAADTE